MRTHDKKETSKLKNSFSRYTEVEITEMYVMDDMRDAGLSNEELARFKRHRSREERMKLSM